MQGVAESKHWITVKIAAVLTIILFIYIIRNIYPASIFLALNTLQFLYKYISFEHAPLHVVSLKLIQGS